MFPIALSFGPDGALYVALPAFGADEGNGDLARLESMTADTTAVLTEESTCTPIPETLPQSSETGRSEAASTR
jgi:hypothetical protein